MKVLRNRQLTIPPSVNGYYKRHTMRQIITTFLILLSFYGYAQKSQIKGAIKGIDKAVINVLVLPIKEGETPIFDTTYCANGEFKYTLNYNVDMWHLVILSSEE